MIRGIIVEQPAWYALRTRSRHENVVSEYLQSKSFDVFYPQIEGWSKRKDRKKKIFKPLFSGYLFVHCPLTKEKWLSIVKTFGVVDLLGQTNKPSPIPEDQIESVKRVIAANIPFKPHPFLSIGDKVIVSAGPLKGAIGIYNAYDHKKGKLIVSVDLLNRSIEVEIESEYLDPY